MDDFIKGLGRPYMAHVLRRLYDDFVRNIEHWYEEFGVAAPPRTHSTMVLLDREGPLGVTEVADKLRQSHPLVLTWVRQLKHLGFVQTSDDPADARRTLLSLTEAGKAQLQKNWEADRVVGEAYRVLMQEADAPIFDALWRMEAACREEPLLERLRRAERSLSEKSTAPKSRRRLRRDPAA
jgi:DNA-binding MarR family transcriptional regulator